MVSRFEIRKDTVQVITESAATHVGRMAMIVSGAVRELTHELGEWATDVFEIREAAGRADADRLDDPGEEREFERGLDEPAVDARD